MNQELEARLIEDYPRLFQKVHNPMSPMVFGVECGDGWHGLIRGFCEFVTARNIPEASFSQIKEKYGQLRLYVDGGDAETYAEAERVLRKSATVCESCGEPGHSSPTGWIVVLCEKCRNSRENRGI